jgi:alkylated DNA repair protein alkB family protein 6
VNGWTNYYAVTELLLLQDDVKVASLLLERRSLVVLQDDMYTKYLHTIAEVHCDTLSGTEANLELCGGQYTTGAELQRATRISLTVRHVPRTSKLCIKLCR